LSSANNRREGRKLKGNSEPSKSLLVIDAHKERSRKSHPVDGGEKWVASGWRWAAGNWAAAVANRVSHLPFEFPLPSSEAVKCATLWGIRSMRGNFAFYPASPVFFLFFSTFFLFFSSSAESLTHSLSQLSFLPQQLYHFPNTKCLPSYSAPSLVSFVRERI